MVWGSTTNQKIEEIVDENNPFHLRHSNNLGSMLVSQHLTGENYSTWSKAMLMALRVKKQKNKDPRPHI